MERFSRLTKQFRSRAAALVITALFFIAVSSEALADSLDILPTRIGVAQDAGNHGLLGETGYYPYITLTWKSGRDFAWSKMLIQFDLSPLKSKLSIVSASMYLRTYEGGKVNIYPLLVDWEEYEVDYHWRKSGVPWASNYIESSTGIDFDGSPVASGVVLPSVTYTAVDVTEITQDWIDGNLENNGLLINYYDHSSGCDIFTKEAVGLAPYMLIQYEPLYESRIGDFSQNNTAFLISSDYLRGEVHGDVSSATVDDASPFATNKMEWMLGHLAANDDVLAASSAIDSASNENQETRINNNKSKIGILSASDAIASASNADQEFHINNNTSQIGILSASDAIASASNSDQETRLNNSVKTNPLTSADNTIVSPTPDVSPLTVKGASGQIADLLRILNDLNETLARIDAEGNLHSPQIMIDNEFFRLYSDDVSGLATIEFGKDLHLKPVAGAKIVPGTMMEFDDFLGDKVRYYSDSYKIGVSPFDLDITSDRNIKFHSDTSPDLMVIYGDDGDVTVKRDVQSGRDVISSNVFKFSYDSVGDKLRLYGTQYRLAISPNTFDLYSDQLFKFHSDANGDAMVLDADSGNLTLEGKMRADDGFNVDGTDGVSGTISPASSIIVYKGIIVGFY